MKTGYIPNKVAVALIILGIITIIGVYLTSCAPKHVGLSELQTYNQEVRKCMEVPDNIPNPQLIVDNTGDTVMCNGQTRKGCYNGIIHIAQQTTDQTVKHEMVHYYADKVLHLGNDADHKCMMNGQSCYLKCSGITME